MPLSVSVHLPLFEFVPSVNNVPFNKMVGLDLFGQSKRKIPGVTRRVEEGQAGDSLCVVPGSDGGIDRDKHFVAYFTNQLRGREKEKGIKTTKRVKPAAKM